MNLAESAKRNCSNNNVSSYWLISAENFYMSPLEFYTAVENAFQKIKVPDRLRFSVPGMS